MLYFSVCLKIIKYFWEDCAEEKKNKNEINRTICQKKKSFKKTKNYISYYNIIYYCSSFR